MAGVSGKKDSVPFFLVIARYLAVMACGGGVYRFEEDYIDRRYIPSQVPCQMKKSPNPRAFRVWRRPRPIVGAVHLSAFGMRLSANGHFRAVATIPKGAIQSAVPLGRQGRRRRDIAIRSQ